MTEKPIKPVKLSRAALFFLVIAVLGIVVGTVAPFFTVVGIISAVLAAITGGLWWINWANGRKGL